MARLPNLRRLKLPEQDLKKSTVCHLLNLPLQQISNLKTNDDLGAINHFPFNLRVIPSAFFSNCSIRAIDITVPSRVSQIGENFCEEVRNLAFVRIANQSLRWNINGAFGYCEHLVHLILTNLPNVRIIYMSFCEMLFNLKTATLGLPNLTTIGSCFFSRSGIEKLDISECSNISFIGAFFLYECRKLQEIKFPANLSRLFSIGEAFMYYCTSLKKLDFRAFGALKIISSRFLEYLHSLEQIIWPTFHQLDEIDDNFMAQCKKLQTIDLRPFANVKRIGSDFLEYTDSLEHVQWPVFHQLKTIGLNFMYSSGIKTLNLVHFPALETIGYNFLFWSEIEEIHLENLNPHIKVDQGFLWHCECLRKIYWAKGQKMPIWLENLGPRPSNSSVEYVEV